MSIGVVPHRIAEILPLRRRVQPNNKHALTLHSLCISILVSEVFRNQFELLQRRFQVFDHLLRDHLRSRKVLRVLQRFVLEPEDVEARLVACDKFLVAVGAPAAVGVLLRPRGFALVAVLRVVAGDELVQVRALEEIRLQREVLVGPQIVDPELLRPRRLGGGLLVDCTAPVCARRPS